MKNKLMTAFFLFVCGIILAGGTRSVFRVPPKDLSELALVLRVIPLSGEICHEATAEEKSKMLPHMRQDRICSRNRPHVLVNLTVDGKEVFSKSLKPLGLNSDGAVVALETLPLSTGPHHVAVHIRDNTEDPNPKFKFEQEVELVRGRKRVIEFDQMKGFQLL